MTEDAGRPPPAAQRPRSVTIYDVAQRAGVSIKTVSRVMNREAKVSAETRRQVSAVIDELSYRPNISARRLAGSRSFLLGLLVLDASPDYVGRVQFGAQHRCRSDGYHLLVELVDPLGGVEQVRALVKDLRLDGLILTPPVCDDLQVLDVLEALAIPHVRIAPGLQPERAARVEVDDRRAAQEMTARLIGLGHERIGFVSGPAHHLAALNRLQGYRDAFAAAGLSVEAGDLARGDFTFASGVEAGLKLLGRDDRPSAVFAANDDMALGVLSAAARLRLKAPDQLAVAGFDGALAGQTFSPPLTTLRQPAFDLGRVAADLLITGELAEGEGGFKAVCMPCLLLEGGTLGPRSAGEPGD